MICPEAKSLQSMRLSLVHVSSRWAQVERDCGTASHAAGNIRITSHPRKYVHPHAAASAGDGAPVHHLAGCLGVGPSRGSDDGVRQKPAEVADRRHIVNLNFADDCVEIFLLPVSMASETVVITRCRDGGLFRNMPIACESAS